MREPERERDELLRYQEDAEAEMDYYRRTLHALLGPAMSEVVPFLAADNIERDAPLFNRVEAW